MFHGKTHSIYFKMLQLLFQIVDNFSQQEYLFLDNGKTRLQKIKILLYIILVYHLFGQCLLKQKQYFNFQHKFLHKNYSRLCFVSQTESQHVSCIL